ncbi:MAG TPA: hypothetical protein VLX33_00010 [Nitrososphaerales archaeon]|nr:hypothetical protein [Nitrososphaerales archaeon]
MKKAVLETYDPTERKIRFMALLTSALPKGRRPVLRAWDFSLGDLTTWASEALGLGDVVGEGYTGSYEKVTTITTQYGLATIAPIEDLVVKRLASAKSWNLPTDVEQAFLLAKGHDDNTDWGYVQEESRRAEVDDYLAKLKEMLAKGGR